jgi:hypothetical protein
MGIRGTFTTGVQGLGMRIQKKKKLSKRRGEEADR